MAKDSFPSYVTQFFWGDDLAQLSLENNSEYILQTILNIGDQNAIKWIFNALDKEFIIKILPSLKLTPKSAHFWNIYLS